MEELASGKTNFIAKEEALSWLHDNRNRFTPDYNARRLFEVTVMGSEYVDDYGQSMSYLCRAYSITEFGSSRNRIKNVYKKYLNQYDADEIRSAISRIVFENPNGIEEEYPYFETRLKQILSGETAAFEPDGLSGIHSYGQEESYDMNRVNLSAGSGLKQKLLIGAAVVAVILIFLFRKQVFRFGFLAIVGLLAVGLIFIILKAAGALSTGLGSAVQSARSSGGRKVKGRRVTGKNILLGVIWAGIFIYAGSYYVEAGHPASWSIIAAVIGIGGGIAIVFKDS